MTGYVLLLSIFNIPLRAQVVDSASSIQAALRLLPLLVATAVGSVLGGGASSKTKLLSWSLMAASSLMALGTGLLSSLPSDGSFTNAQYGYEVILGLGLGITMSAITVLTSITVEPRDHGMDSLPYFKKALTNVPLSRRPRHDISISHPRRFDRYSRFDNDNEQTHRVRRRGHPQCRPTHQRLSLAPWSYSIWRRDPGKGPFEPYSGFYG